MKSQHNDKCLLFRLCMIDQHNLVHNFREHGGTIIIMKTMEHTVRNRLGSKLYSIPNHNNVKKCKLKFLASQCTVQKGKGQMKTVGKLQTYGCLPKLADWPRKMSL